MNDSPPKIRVIKLGGSRLVGENLKSEIAGWLSTQPPANNVWIVGGGRAVEELRQKDRIKILKAIDVHWEAIRIMDQNAIQLGKLFPNWPLVNKCNAIASSPITPGNQILLVSNWLFHDEPTLPMNWDVTSDSIAAVVAQTTRARELVLLKSTDPPIDGTLASARETGFVDSYFETAVATWKSAVPHPHLRAVNMACNAFRESELT